MALQTLTSSLNSSPTASSSVSDDKPNSPVGSPPLILAFLAIGLFFAAMVSIFGWRRVHFGTWLSPENQHSTEMNNGAAGSHSISLQRPILWDYYSTFPSKTGEGTKELEWDNVMPLSAQVIVKGDSSSRASDPKPVTSRQHRIDRSTQRTTSLRSRISHSLDVIPFLNKSPRHKHTAECNAGKDSRQKLAEMRVAVAIALPSSRHAYYRMSSPGSLDLKRERENEKVEYSIGLYTSPWNDYR